MQHIRIGSRGSDLALWQANHVKRQLENLGCSVDITIITTQGDAIQHLSFDKLEGKGFFTKEIEQALLDNTIDLAVHSHKDLETNQPEGLKIACVSEREDPADLLLIAKGSVDTSKVWNLKENASVGTSSARRKSQVLRFRDDVQIRDLRGNVPTRIQKLRDNQYDAILLAKAGVDRLEIDLSEFEVFVMDPTEFVPAPAHSRWREVCMVNTRIVFLCNLGITIFNLGCNIVIAVTSRYTVRYGTINCKINYFGSYEGIVWLAPYIPNPDVKPRSRHSHCSS